jgi:hypothetical protein
MGRSGRFSHPFDGTVRTRIGSGAPRRGAVDDDGVGVAVGMVLRRYQLDLQARMIQLPGVWVVGLH